MYEVDQDGNVIRVKSLDMPASSSENAPEAPEAPGPSNEDVVMEEASKPQDPEPSTAPAESTSETKTEPQAEEAPTAEPVSSTEVPWPAEFDAILSSYFSEDGLLQLKQMFLEGPEPPFVSDGGWAGRVSKPDEGTETVPSEASAPKEEPSSSRGKRGRDRGRRGGRGGRGGGRGGGREDHRRASSNVSFLCAYVLIVLTMCFASSRVAHILQVRPNCTSQDYTKTLQWKARY